MKKTLAAFLLGLTALGAAAAAHSHGYYRTHHDAVDSRDEGPSDRGYYHRGYRGHGYGPHHYAYYEDAGRDSRDGRREERADSRAGERYYYEGCGCPGWRR